MAKFSSPFRYTQRRNEPLPKLTLRVEKLPLPGGLKPASISVLDGRTVIGSLSHLDLESAIKEWIEGHQS